MDDCLTLANIEAVANHEASKAKPDSNIARILLGPPGDQSFRTKDLVDKMRNDPTLRIWKVVIGSEGEEKIIAYAFWNFYTEAKPIEEWKDIDWPAQANRDGCNQYMASVVAMRKKHMSGRKFGCRPICMPFFLKSANMDLVLQVLATRREYRGHGIGSALIIKGLEEGIKLELTEFWLEASPDGYRLYEKFGFRDVEAIPADLSKYGGVGMAQLMAMKKIRDT